MSYLTFCLVAAIIGTLVGAVEIFQRYRAEPLEAVSNRWGLAYLLFNGLVSAAAFHVAWLANELGKGTTTQLQLFQWATLSGFGASALLRAKLMNIQLGDGKEVALGPEILVQTFLNVIDRELDRERARDRFETVRELMADIDFERSKLRLPLQIFQAMQAVTEEESATLMERIREVDAMDSIGPQDKSYLLGFYLLDLVGPDFLRDILAKYKADFEAIPATPATPPEA